MTPDDITLLVLAGGQGRRMGGVDKGWTLLNGRPLIVHVLSRLEGQAGQVLINANRSLDAYGRLGPRVVSDLEGDFQGPLMGMLSGMATASTPWVLVVPCDTPALPETLVQRMVAGIGENDIAVAHDGQRAHPVVALIRRALVDDLRETLAAGERKIDRWYARHDWCHVDFSDQPLAFANLNSPRDKDDLARRLEHDGSA
ncbi:molybdenum cofactor guanylyltransferase [Modicisalibacter ilicicola DSM 19980]|uniref:Molybdenum cofactor guanylyltransferase n=1 Tax=Modicisalibacter ilicicola DSM 19980 TaxID=1121942 RepID=A0A1M4Z5W4_9GAMM|nr:molybdenum cofactor guanylyltransferase MobA [Halomonas ilicicola]SHF13414.1 molybdenum cofactor guanylyltransferase [Halomonas ilicicola DSM 19980]